MNEYLNKVIDFGESNMRNGLGKRIQSFLCFVYLSLTPFTSSITVYAHLKGFEY
jgi:hypothetical protein